MLELHKTTNKFSKSQTRPNKIIIDNTILNQTILYKTILYETTLESFTLDWKEALDVYMNQGHDIVCENVVLKPLWEKHVGRVKSSYNSMLDHCLDKEELLLVV